MRKINPGKILSRILIVAGLLLIIGAAAIEAYRYPWASLTDGGGQSEDSISDPEPIVLTDDDANSIITVTVPDESGSEETSASTDNSASEEPPAESSLPGEDNTESSPAEAVYIQLGIIKIPEINVSQYVLEGTQRQMRYGVGHVIGTAGLGQEGNCVLAGHNTTSFHYLKNLDIGDNVILKADGNIYEYTVYEIFTVLPDELWVLDEVQGKDYTLTLITCTPYVLSTHRLIVRAMLNAVNDLTPEEYYGAESTGDEIEAHAPPTG